MQIATLLLVYYIAAICIWPISSESELAINTGKNAYQYVYARFAVTILSAVYSHINTGMAWERCKSGMACIHP